MFNDVLLCVESVGVMMMDFVGCAEYKQQQRLRIYTFLPLGFVVAAFILYFSVLQNKKLLLILKYLYSIKFSILFVLLLVNS